MEDEIDESVLRALESISLEDSVESVELAGRIGVEHQTLVDSSLKALVAREAIEAEAISHSRWELTEEGKKYAEVGSPEALVFTALEEPTAMDRLGEKLPEEVNASLGMQQAMKKKWIKMEKATKILSRCVDEITDDVAYVLRSVQNDPNAAGTSPNTFHTQIVPIFDRFFLITSQTQPHQPPFFPSPRDVVIIVFCANPKIPSIPC